jgi:hypothetical protein
MNPIHTALLASLLVAAELAGQEPPVVLRQDISQHGITWTFSEPHQVGQFITGDWWVVGPVTITGVTPAPGEAGPGEAGIGASSRYGATALTGDRRMRNGSMLLLDARLATSTDAETPDPGRQQGYDSRPGNYHPALSVRFPLQLAAQRSLISTISSTQLDQRGELATPYACGEAGLPLCPKTLPLVLKTAAILTCLDRPPPPDSFRPAYVGSEKTLYRLDQVQWSLLPRLKAVPAVPDPEAIAELFARPWLDHCNSWFVQYLGPGLNQPNYGREFARLTSIAGLMLLLDRPAEQQRRLMIGYLQLGIDLSGLARNGRQWFPDGGHWQGRKWPILFASLMLGSPELRQLPELRAGQTLYERVQYRPEAGDQPATTCFQEDLGTYFGLGGDGQRALWQIGFHTGPRPPYEEKKRAQLTKDDLFSDAYLANNAGAWIGSALAAQLMGAKALWNHDAYFDFVDRWMRPEEPFATPSWYPAGCTRSVDLFVEQMWTAHRQHVPVQPGGTAPRRWMWTPGQRHGRFIPNPRVSP